MFKPGNLLFCLHDGPALDENAGVVVITFCPASYWKKNNCLPSGYWATQISDKLRPEDFSWLIMREETMWITSRSREEALEILLGIGFKYSIELETFIGNCYSCG